MKDLNEKDIELIEEMIEHGDEVGARNAFSGLHPADIAELFQSLDIKEAEWAFNLIDDKEKKADVLMELDEEDRKKLLENMDPEQIGHFIDLLDTDDAVDLIQGNSTRKTAKRSSSISKGHGAGGRHRGSPPV